jgi:hypothetical protein
MAAEKLRVEYDLPEAVDAMIEWLVDNDTIELRDLALNLLHDVEVLKAQLRDRQTPTADPRVWTIPESPGPEVERLRDRNGAVYVRQDNRWTCAPERPGNGWYFLDLLVARFPLADATEEPSP